MKKLLLFSCLFIGSLVGTAQRIGTTPQGETVILITVDSLGLSSDSATYSAICDAAAQKGYELWPETINPREYFITSLQDLLRNGNAYLATSGPVEQDGQEFLYKLSYKKVIEHEISYSTLKAEPWGYVDTSVYPKAQQFLFRKP